MVHYIEVSTFTLVIFKPEKQEQEKLKTLYQSFESWLELLNRVHNGRGKFACDWKLR